MEKWKIAVIAALLLSLVGFGAYQQNQQNQPPTPGPTPSQTPVPSPYLGKVLPAWNFSTWNTQKPVSLSSLKGKTTLLEIFRIECSHCRDAAPFMVALDKRYGPRGLKMIGIQSPGQTKDPQNPENHWKTVQSWLKEREVKYPVAFDDESRYFQGTLQKLFLNNDPSKLLYPTLMLIGPDGKIEMAQTGHDTAKAIALAVELEKRFPTGKDLAKNAADLAKWLIGRLPELQTGESMSKALADDIAQRLK
jgi:thiol-disulfide isomerase/thioredoxin